MIFKLIKLFNIINNKLFIVGKLNQNFNSKFIHSISPRNKMKLVFDPRLKGIKQIDKELFKMNLNVPAIKIRKIDYLKARRLLKNFSFDSIVNCKKFTNLNADDALFNSHKYILLDPENFNFENLDENIKNELINILKEDNTRDISNTSFIENIQVNLDYDDFKFDDILKAIIPDELLKENINVKGYSVIGHIAHFNLKDKVLEYKTLIGIYFNIQL